MIYNQYYNLEVSLNGQALEISPNETYFSMHDSIHNFFSNSTIMLNDPFGLMREYMMSIEGTSYELSYGIENLKNNLLKNSYVTISDETQEVMSSGTLNGKISLNLLNNFYDKQEVKNAAYKKPISSIISSLIEDFLFKAKDIESTQGVTTWYQLGMNQKDFIEKVLIPNAYSDSADKTPFFVFIDNNNVFNFKSYKTMFNSSPVATLNFNPIKKDSSSIDSIYDIKPFRTGSLKTKSKRNRTLVSRSLKDGSFTKEKDLMSSYPGTKESGALLPMLGDEKLVTDLYYQSYQYTDQGRKESFLGRKISGQKDGFFLEKFLITLPFNPLLNSGKTIILNVTILNEHRIPEYSLYNSGKYLIEDCIHSWIGGDIKRGSTQIIVSRKYCFIPSTFNLKAKIIG